MRDVCEKRCPLNMPHAPIHRCTAVNRDRIQANGTVRIVSSAARSSCQHRQIPRGNAVKEILLHSGRPAADSSVLLVPHEHRNELMAVNRGDHRLTTTGGQKHAATGLKASPCAGEKRPGHVRRKGCSTEHRLGRQMELTPDRSDPDSSPCSRRPRNPSRTSPVHRSLHRLPPVHVVGRGSQRSDRRGCRPI